MLISLCTRFTFRSWKSRLSVLSFTLSCFMWPPVSSEQLVSSLLFSSTFWVFSFQFKPAPSLSSGAFYPGLLLSATLFSCAWSLLVFSCAVLGWGGWTLGSGNRQVIELWDLHCETWLILLRNGLALFTQQVQIYAHFKIFSSGRSVTCGLQARNAFVFKQKSFCSLIQMMYFYKLNKFYMSEHQKRTLFHGQPVPLMPWPLWCFVHNFWTHNWKDS